MVEEYLLNMSMWILRCVSIMIGIHPSVSQYAMPISQECKARKVRNMWQLQVL